MTCYECCDPEYCDCPCHRDGIVTVDPTVLRAVLAEVARREATGTVPDPPTIYDWHVCRAALHLKHALGIRSRKAAP